MSLHQDVRAYLSLYPRGTFDLCHLQAHLLAHKKLLHPGVRVTHRQVLAQASKHTHTHTHPCAHSSIAHTQLAWSCEAYILGQDGSPTPVQGTVLEMLSPSTMSREWVLLRVLHCKLIDSCDPFHSIHFVGKKLVAMQLIQQIYLACTSTECQLLYALFGAWRAEGMRCPPFFFLQVATVEACS